MYFHLSLKNVTYILDGMLTAVVDSWRGINLINFTVKRHKYFTTVNNLGVTFYGVQIQQSGHVARSMQLKTTTYQVYLSSSEGIRIMKPISD